MQKQANQQYQNQNNQKSSKPEGAISIDYMPPSQTGKADKLGDFVEFEEVK